MKYVILASAAALALAGCNTMEGAAADARSAGDAVAAAVSGPDTPTEAMPFVMKAGASDQFEIQSSQLALQKSQNADVRRYAQKLVDHHMMTTRDVTAAAQKAGITPPPPQLEPMQQQMIAELQPLSGAQFDAAYMRQQVPAHEMALALHTNYAKNGDTPSLKAAASKARPLVQQHLDEARSMSAKM